MLLTQGAFLVAQSVLTKDLMWITDLANIHHFRIADEFWIQSQKTWVSDFNCRSFAVCHSVSPQMSLVLGSRVQWPRAELYSWQIWKLAPAWAGTGVWPPVHEPFLSLGSSSVTQKSELVLTRHWVVNEKFHVRCFMQCLARSDCSNSCLLFSLLFIFSVRKWEA